MSGQKDRPVTAYEPEPELPHAFSPFRRQTVRLSVVLVVFCTVAVAPVKHGLPMPKMVGSHEVRRSRIRCEKGVVPLIGTSAPWFRSTLPVNGMLVPDEVTSTWSV